VSVVNLSASEFWAIKHETDAIALKLGWSKDYCKRYVQVHYGCKSRLVMTDDQLHHLLTALRLLLVKKQSSGSVSRKRNRRR
jgi:hypothetical protein